MRVFSQEFYSGGNTPLQQGDILLGSVARIASEDKWGLRQWSAIDSVLHEGMPSLPSSGGSNCPALILVGGRALTMITTHDCGLDKEFNVVLRQSIKDNPGLDQNKLAQQIDARNDLDRFFQVSPLIDPATIFIGGKMVNQDNLLSGKIIGYLPVPEFQIGDKIVIPRCVVDLTYRTTVDKFSYERRLTSISESARQSLRYGLMKLDSLRSTSALNQLNDIFGQSVVSAKISKKNPLLILLEFENGTIIELLKTPASPDPNGPARSKENVS